MAVYDRLLAAWPETTEQIYVDTRHGRTFVLAVGEETRPPVVLLHGSGSNALSWGADLPALSRHFRVVAVDTPGEPGRSVEERIPWRGAGVVEWLGDLLDGLGCERAALVGISQGGWLALRFATATPERVSGLAVLAPGGLTPVRPGFILKAVPLSMLGRRGAEAVVRMTLDTDDLPPEAVDYMGLIMTHFRSRTDAQPIFTDEELRRLDMPVLALTGDRDPIFSSAKTADRLARLLPQADVRLLPGVGHALIGVASVLVPFFLEALGVDGLGGLSARV